MSSAKEDIEVQLTTYWRELFDNREISPEDNFIEIGGHSLLAAHLVAKIRDRYGVDLPLRTVFEHPTIGGQAKELEALLVLNELFEAP